jgi:predicted RNase H-like nuclease (RuvC/YqgF family)
MSKEIEKVSQDEMLRQFRERFESLQEENKKLSQQIRENEGVALKLLGAIEALSYYLEDDPEEDPNQEGVEEVVDPLTEVALSE